MKSFALPVAVLLTAATLSGCLKTRAQLRDEPEDMGTNEQYAQPVPVHVQDAQPGSYLLDEVKTEITRLNGRIEDLERAQASASSGNGQASDEKIKQLETRIAELEQAQITVLETLKKMQASAATLSQAQAPDAESFLDQGKAQMAAKDLEAAIESFSKYLASSKAKKIQEATFLRAESYYGLKQYKKAIVDYSKFPEKFPQSRRLPESLYKIGLSFEGLGMKEDARAFFQDLVDRFPKSDEAKKAKSKLK